MLKKIERIFESFYEGENKPTLWAIGTDFHKTWIKFGENVKNNKIPLSEIKEIEVIRTNEKKNYGKILINGVNVTPIIKIKKNLGQIWSEGAIRQLLQHGSALNIVFWDGKNSIWGKWKITSEFLKYAEANTNYENAYRNLIVRGINSEIDYCKNIAFTLFCAFVYRNDINLFDQLKKTSLNGRIVKKTGVQKNNINIFLSNSDDLKKFFEGGINFGHQSITRECYKRTYSSAVEFLSTSSIGDTIEKILCSLEIKNDYVPEGKANYKNIVEMIQSLRSNFRNVLIEARVPKNAKNYCDLIAKCNDKEIQTSIIQLDAAHIFEVNQIIENISFENGINSETLNEIKKQVLDVNNGLLIPVHYHRAFDRGIIGFGINGELLLREGDYNFENLHIQESYIKREIFNDGMKKYFSKR